MTTACPPKPAISDAKPMIAAAIDSIAGLATLPEITAQIIRTVEDPRSDVTKLRQIVGNDPALATRVLKLVNSAFYGLPGQVATIDRAIVMLGLNAVKNLAVAASLGQMFRGNTLGEGFTAKDLWTHCLAVACGARELSRLGRLPIADEAFLAGLIHDVGLLVSLQVWPERLRQACAAAARGRSFCDAEREFVGVDHQQLGRALLQKWTFPAACLDVAGSHHASSSPHSVVTVVAIADALAVEGGFGFTLTRRGESAESLNGAGIVPAEAIAETRERLPELVRVASSTFA